MDKHHFLARDFYSGSASQHGTKKDVEDWAARYVTNSNNRSAGTSVIIYEAIAMVQTEVPPVKIIAFKE